MLEATSQAFLLAHPEHFAAMSTFARALERRAGIRIDSHKIVYLKCPACEGPMVRKNFAKVSGVIVDECLRHGTWYDAGELPAILAFLRQGGDQRRAAFEAREKETIARWQERIQVHDGKLRGQRTTHGLMWDI